MPPLRAASPPGTALASSDVKRRLDHAGMRNLLFAFALLPGLVHAAPSAVSTFHSIGLYWSPEGGAEFVLSLPAAGS